MDTEDKAFVIIFVITLVMIAFLAGKSLGESGECNNAQLDIEKVSELLQGYERCEIITATMHKDKNDTVVLECW